MYIRIFAIEDLNFFIRNLEKITLLYIFCNKIFDCLNVNCFRRSENVPPKTTECMAPSRALAKIAMIVSGMRGI